MLTRPEVLKMLRLDLSLIMNIYRFGVSDAVRHKLACSALALATC